MSAEWSWHHTGSRQAVEEALRDIQSDNAFHGVHGEGLELIQRLEVEILQVMGICRFMVCRLPDRAQVCPSGAVVRAFADKPMGLCGPSQTW